MDKGIIINYVILVLFGLAVGLVSAIPIGAVQVQVVKTALRGHRGKAIAMALGSGTSDLVYGLLTILGLGPVLTSSLFQIIFYSMGAAVLSVILYRSVREHRNLMAGNMAPGNQKRRNGFITGLIMAITNPSIVLFWIVGYGIMADLGLFREATLPVRLVYVISGSAGLAGYLALLAVIVHRIHRNFSERVLHRMNLALICILVPLIGYFIWKVVQSLLLR